MLVEGPAGTGKTQLAKSVAEITGARLIRLQCYEGLDESKALYEWNYKKQLLRIQAERNDGATWSDVEDDIFSDEFLLTRPLLEAIRAEEPVVLLIDEVDRVEVETEALLLEILSDYQVSIPELGTVTARQVPLVFLTSNNTRELSEALKRRCLFLHVDYPDLDREREIVMAKVPGITDSLADQVARIVRSIRQLELKKPPSVSETLDWARTLLLLGVEQVDAATAVGTANILLKYQSDITKATKELEQDTSLGGEAAGRRGQALAAQWLTPDDAGRRPTAPTATAARAGADGARPPARPGARARRRRGRGHRHRGPPRAATGTSARPPAAALDEADARLDRGGRRAGADRAAVGLHRRAAHGRAARSASPRTSTPWRPSSTSRWSDRDGVQVRARRDAREERRATGGCSRRCSRSTSRCGAASTR